ncbi:MAG: BMP family ABC transporter substrate-binding protein, partial [Ruthenibacterium sp.]
MKKLLAIMMAAILAGSVLVGCTKAPESKAESAAGSTSASAAPTEDVVNVTLLGAGYGDKSFWDSAKAGAEALEATYPGKVKVKIV